MAKKDFQGIGKNIIDNKGRPTSLEELISDSENHQNTEKPELRINEKRKNHKHDKPDSRKPEYQKLQGNIRYEARINEELDKRFRRYMFEQRLKTNAVLIAALDYFLTKHGY